MNLFDVFELAVAMQQVTVDHITCVGLKAVGTGTACQIIPDNLYAKIVEDVRKAREVCASIGFQDSYAKIRLSVNQLEFSKMDTSSTETELRNILEQIRFDLLARKFLTVRIDRVDYVDQPNLFGESVALAFPSTLQDTREAGNCLAAECGTAAVFHLMRAAEVAMRALAKDRRVEFADKPLDQKEWGQILDNLDSKIKALRQEPLVTWKIPQVKEEQIRFYAEVAQELRAFNEAWRRHISHADTKAFYDRDEALSIMNHVRAFIQKLSTRINEDNITAVYWRES